METIQLDSNRKYYRSHSGVRREMDGSGVGQGECDMMYNEGECDLAVYYAQLGVEGNIVEPRQHEDSNVITTIQEDATELAALSVKLKGIPKG